MEKTREVVVENRKAIWLMLGYAALESPCSALHRLRRGEQPFSVQRGVARRRDSGVRGHIADVLSKRVFR